MTKISKVSISDLRTLAKTETDINNMWEILKACNGDIGVLTYLARNPNIIKDLSFISEICRKGDYTIRVIIVESIEDEDILSKFVEDNDVCVRLAVARKTKKNETIEKLSQDNWWGVRLELITRNENLPKHIIEKFAKDSNEHYKIRGIAQEMLKGISE